MATTLYFRNQAFGDQVISYWLPHQAETPPVMHAGLFRSYVGVNTFSRNLLHVLAARVYLVRGTQHLCQAAISDVRQHIGLRGVLEVRDGGSAVVTTDDQWVLLSAESPPADPGFGGRLTTELVLTFGGELPPLFA